MRYLAVSVVLHLFFLGALKVTERKAAGRGATETSWISVGRYFPERASATLPARKGNISPHTLNAREGDEESQWPLYMPPPRYPRKAKENGWQGEVVFKLRTDPYGHIESLDILSSSGYALLDEEAYQTVKQWRMVPKLVAEIPIVFKLTE